MAFYLLSSLEDWYGCLQIIYSHYVRKFFFYLLVILHLSFSLSLSLISSTLLYVYVTFGTCNIFSSSVCICSQESFFLTPHFSALSCNHLNLSDMPAQMEYVNCNLAQCSWRFCPSQQWIYCLQRLSVYLSLALSYFTALCLQDHALT